MNAGFCALYHKAMQTRSPSNKLDACGGATYNAQNIAHEYAHIPPTAHKRGDPNEI